MVGSHVLKMQLIVRDLTEKACVWFFACQAEHDDRTAFGELWLSLGRSHLMNVAANELAENGDVANLDVPPVDCRPQAIPRRENAMANAVARA